MKSTAITFAFALAAGLSIPSAFAGSEIVRCVDAQGHVTLTDEPCPASSAVAQVLEQAPESAAEAATDAEQAPSAPPPLAAAGAGVAVEHFVAPPSERRALIPFKPRTTHAAMPTDESTLKAAKLRLDELDKSMPGRQRLAGIN